MADTLVVAQVVVEADIVSTSGKLRVCLVIIEVDALRARPLLAAPAVDSAVGIV